MDNTTFENLVKEIRAASMDTLTAKNAKYATDGDRLHNFVAGGDVMGGTAARACWGYLTKHLVALRDKVERNDFSDREDLKEKCQDAINYIVFLWCIGNETRATSARFPGNEERAKQTRLGSAEEAHSETYRDMAKKLAPERVRDDFIGGVRGCPGDLLEGAPKCRKAGCEQKLVWRDTICTECWDQPYKGERARDDIGGT